MKKKLLQILIAFYEDFTTKRVMNAASMLTYSTLLAIVPISAVIFAIARGFGYNKYIETWFRDTLSSQPQAVEIIIGFVNSYLVHTKSGIVFGFGLVFMLYTIIMLTRNVEMTFNDIWNIHEQRSLMRTFTDYLAMFFLLPILIIVVSGIILWMGSLSKMVDEVYVIGPVLAFGIDLLPIILLTIIIELLYVFMPNTNVKWGKALVPAIFAAIGMELLQYFYVHSQIWVSGYNAIYGSFAALPLFMLWLQFTWTIILIGAEMAYANQNSEDMWVLTQKQELSISNRITLAAIVMSHICHRFKAAHRPYTMLEMKAELNLPMQVVSDVFFDLKRAGLLHSVTTSRQDEEVQYVPAESIENITMGKLIDRMETMTSWMSEDDLKKHTNTKKWQRTILMHDNYLRAQQDIKLYELIDSSGPSPLTPSR